MLKLKKGNKVIYLGNMPYKLGNEQEVFKEGEELLILSDVSVQKEFFILVEEKLENVVKPELKESPNKDLNKKDDKKIDNKLKKKK
jgi:hypothetical protein